jgi:hypothetical protein
MHKSPLTKLSNLVVYPCRHSPPEYRHHGQARPTPNYKPDFCPIAYKFCLLGATNEDLADLFEVSLASIGNWLAKYPEFKKAVQEGRAWPIPT